jgi:putative intracellular protease/amidase
MLRHGLRLPLRQRAAERAADQKPTVVIELVNDVTEVADALGPYVAFKTAGAFNVATVAERRVPVALSGGLDVVPDFSFAELDAQLGRDPDLIVVPNIPNVRGNDAVRTWLRQHGGRRSGGGGHDG